jgi:hypothetical protein
MDQAIVSAPKHQFVCDCSLCDPVLLAMLPEFGGEGCFRMSKDCGCRLSTLKEVLPKTLFWLARVQEQIGIMISIHFKTAWDGLSHSIFGKESGERSSV